MKARIKIQYLCLTFLLSLGMAACVDHLPNVEDLPNPDVAFKYEVADDIYQIDYYVGATIKFISTSAKPGECTWDFGDGSTPQVGEEVTHKYKVAGTYDVKLTVAGVGSLQQVIYISDIRPIVDLMQEDSVCEVLTSAVAFDVEVPNPEGLEEVYTWIFPPRTTNEAGETVERFIGKDPGKLKFGNVGSQRVRLQVTLGGRQLDETMKNVQVGYNKEVPTLYYAMKGGNIMALKLAGADKPADMEIAPFDMGVNSGQTPMNILFDKENLYVLDPGRQFTYVDDENKNMGDGRIFAMSKDGNQVQTVLTSKAWAMHDPFYGYIDGTDLYYADRNMGIRKIKTTDRNLLFSETETYSFVENNRLGYYGSALPYGSISGCIGKVKDVWYWCKTYQGTGIFRFLESDILPAAIGNNEGTAPAAGIALKGNRVKSFVYDEVNDRFCFTLFDSKIGGFYVCKLEELDKITTNAALAQYRKQTVNGEELTLITENGKGEGSSDEYIGICQLSLDKTDGSVYFGFRSGDPDVKSGLMRYNPVTDKIEYVIENVSVLGVSINSTPSKLF